ncbi:endonuclease/exonuclease/phosphatase family protein [Nitzschia inconspicua]|uniref:Endonuclease/exonuclease/phosphatase family protein n=1 Tax=Nitzschia inconspicua TaxID=303405 RepID=A0A9K3KUX5_9STRA|nr:endonuclease/exonuclease/phosphatase family protein [Nitzschia inconspicua]
MGLSEDSIADSSCNKRLKISGDEQKPPVPSSPNSTGASSATSAVNDCGRHPHTFVTWNCNGFTSRTKWNADELKRLLRETNFPDMICLQEVRLKASGPNHQRGTPKETEFKGSVEAAIQTIFRDYTPFWSLADTKYSGTLSLIHQRCMKYFQWQPSTASSQPSEFAAFTPKSAIDLILRRFNTDRTRCGLAEASAEIDSKDKKTKKAATQMSLTSFFAPKSSSSNINNDCSHTGQNPSHSHHPEGRFQFFFFPDMDVIQTYVPNNGTKDESFQKRQQWDDDMMRFLKERQQILQTCDVHNRKLLWMGDMNVARDYRDGTHWKWRKNDENSDSIYEWWRDESKCFVQGDHKNPTASKKHENIGIPGFTTAERERFANLLQVGDFCDIWRELHPDGVPPQKNEASVWDRGNYTWRGHLSREGGAFAKYQGKAQRLDYFLLSPSKLVNRKATGTTSNLLKSCEILGYGEHKEGLFCGSDHCAVRLELVQTFSSQKD